MTFFYNVSFAHDNAVILFTSTHRNCQKLVYNTLIFQISFQKFKLSTVNMIVVISKDDYGTPVVFVEC